MKKFFVKGMILNKNFFVLSDFELEKFLSRQILNQLFYNAPDLKQIT